MAEPTYIFRNGNVYTMVDGKVVASVKEADFGGHPIQDEVEMPPPPADVEAACPGCGEPVSAGDLYCPYCGTPVGDEIPGENDITPGGGREVLPEDIVHGQMVAKTVTTPNGLKGKVLASVPTVWGEEVTVRFENGVIKRIPVDQRLTFSAAEEAPEGQTSVERLEERLAASTISDKESLLARAKELGAIKTEAASHVEGASDEEAAALDRISVEADYELREIKAALDHLASEEAEAFEPPAPIESVPTVEQASVGGTHANWLDRTVQAMVAEANDTDYEKLMDEGPEAFVAGLDDAQLADAKTVRTMASREIRSHTAGAEEDIRDRYEKVWLARCEEQRKTRLASRKEEVRKEAASSEPVDAPDESLFM